MAIPPYLQDKMSPKKRSPAKIIFNIILIASLGLNVYLLKSAQSPDLAQTSEKWSIEIAQAEAVESIAQTAPDYTPAQVVLARATPTPANVGLMEPVLRPEPDSGEVTPQSRATPVSYVVPETQNQNRNNSGLLTLHLKIRNSLTYSLCRAMTKAQGCEMMSAYLSRLLSWNFDINRSMRNGDALDIAYEKVPGKARFRVLKLVYASQLFNKVYQANYFAGENREWGSYFDAEGREIAKRVVDKFAPVKNYQEITSLPGDFRKGPVGHMGTDFKTDIGTPVFASFEAKVLRTNWNVRVNGYCVELDHPKEGVKTLYLHLSRVLVKPGQYVKQGDKIAETGNTGRTFAPHLHYEIKSRDRKKIVYNPFNFKHIKSFHQEIPLTERENFQKKVRLYDSLLQKG